MGWGVVDLFVKESKAIVREMKENGLLILINIILACLFFVFIFVMKCVLDEKDGIYQQIKHLDKKVELYQSPHLYKWSFKNAQETKTSQ